MKIIFIRHGDPDYAMDSLTPKGWREAKALAAFLTAPGGMGWDIDHFYCSPLGRARDTAGPTLRALGAKADIYDFFREFNREAIDPRTGKKRIPWDYYPADWTKDERAFDGLRWETMPIFEESPEVAAYFHEIGCRLDKLILKYGYQRDGRFYRVRESNHQTICIFCHFGVASMLICHLLNLSPVAFLNGSFIPPTGITLLQTEERDPGIAYFRMNFMGSTPHLALAGEPLSGSGLFQECASDPFRRIGAIHSLREVCPENEPENKILLKP